MPEHPVTVRRHDRYQMIALAGEVDHARVDGLEWEMRNAVETANAIIVDLTTVTFLDSAGLRLLDRLVRWCVERRCAIRVVAPRPGAVRFTIDLMGFRPELIADTAAEAVAAVSPTDPGEFSPPAYELERDRRNGPIP